MDPHDRIRLRHMLDAAREAHAFAQGKGREDLEADRQFALAVVRCIAVVGKAASNVSADTQNAIADIPWRAIINMRHRLVHGYFNINLDIVWQTLTEDLPPLITALGQALRAPGVSDG